MEETNIKEVVEEIKGTDEETLQKTIEGWYERTRTDGLKLGAKMISIVVFETIKKHTKKAGKISLNDYKRMTSEILNIISVQLAENDLEDNTMEESSNDE